MATIVHKAVSSLEAILSSIETDEQVYRWFTFLVVQPVVAKHISSSQSGNEYPKLKNLILVQNTILSVCILSISAILYYKKFIYLWAGLVFIYPLD